eukprot:4006283-Amphidinium_carterae.1
MPVDEGLRLEEPEAKRQRPDVRGRSTAAYEAAGAAQGQTLEAREAASAVEQEEYVDDVYGTLLIADLVRKVRQLELDWIKSREVYKRVPLGECIECTGKKPLSMKWVDADKGDQEGKNDPTTGQDWCAAK